MRNGMNREDKRRTSLACLRNFFHMDEGIRVRR
jgi:hypothetical protein